MKYQCIKCHTSWGEGNPEVDGYSYGLCRLCLREVLTPLYRMRQTKEGSFDSFVRASSHCDQSGRKYREVCLTEA